MLGHAQYSIRKEQAYTCMGQKGRSWGSLGMGHWKGARLGHNSQGKAQGQRAGRGRARLEQHGQNQVLCLAERRWLQGR